MWLAFAASAAFFFGMRGILYHWTSQKPINRTVMLFGAFSTGALVSLTLAFALDQPWTPPAMIGIVLGTISVAANASMYKGFSVGKASVIAILTGFPPVVVVLFAFIFWRETLSLGQLLAFSVIVIGILLVRYSNDISLKQLKGAQWGLITMFCFAFTDLGNKQALLLDASIFPLLSYTFGTGSTLLGLWWLFTRKKQAAPAAAAAVVSGKPWSALKTYFWGMFVGIMNTIAMILVLPAFKLGATGLVSAIIAMNIVLILLYSRLVVKDKFTRIEFVGICLAVIGVVVLRLLGN